MSIQNLPTIQNSPSIYNLGGAASEPFISPLPSSCYLVEYIQFAGVSGNGFFRYYDSDKFEIALDDNLYFKYKGNFTGYGWTTLFSCYVPNGTSRITWEITSDTQSRFTNGGTSSGWTQFGITIPNADDYLFVKRTLNGLETTLGNFAKATTNWTPQKMYLERPLNSHTGNVIKLYRFVITDKDDNIKFDFNPIFNTQNNSVGIWEKVTNTIKYPTLQTGLTPGQRIIY